MAEGLSIPQRGMSLARWMTVAAALVLSACQTVVPRGPAPTIRPQPTRPQTTGPTQVDPGIPTDTARHRVALLVPLTGSNAGVGQSISNATQLALLDTNNERIRITTYDTAALGSANAAQRAIDDGNRLILGPLLADDVKAVAPVAKRAGVPVVSFSNDASAAGNGSYLMGYMPGQSITRVVDYARGQGMSSFAGLVPNGLYGERASTSFLRAVEGAGGQVVTLQTYDRAPGSISAAITRMGHNSPYEAVLIADAANSAAAAVPILRKSGAASARVLGTELWNSDASVNGKPALNGAWFASVPDALYRQYAAKYRARFGTAPFRLSSLGYDAVLLTVRIARDWPIGSAFPEDKLKDRGGFGGIDGAFRFGRDNIAERALEVQEIRGGTTVIVSPAPTGFLK
ncbi:ABC transporter substrate-binding protein [Sphingomonas sp. Leaf357]|uniref:penicillin-binding protein activator n=1 Tax=Sphingomonas sp. Leaf357 TaxID=1736350 RepID=UPI0006FAF9EA|nr:penicillin-binding protein activator [Sphingomonas sp. Leaf357]KQS04264.1 ABC transporter substrate-binding protein [Sphingomonas sp. Leaf357]